MKKSIHLIIVFFTIALLSSCGKHKEDKHTHVESKKATEHQHEENSGLILNNGELWIANKETTQGIDNMVELVHSFTDTESVKAYTKLKSNLEKEFGTIIKECTMQGESHDQLHHFLLPMQEMFEGLGSTDLKICKKNYAVLNEHLKGYPKYFK